MPTGKSGLSALMTRMLSEGTRQKSSLQVAEAAEALGSDLGCGTGRDQAEVNLTVLPGDLEQGLTLLAEVVRFPAFAAAEFQRVRAEWIDRLVAERQNPEQLAILAGLRRLLGPRLGAPVNGALPEVEALQRHELAAMHARVFEPSRLALIVVGNVGFDQVAPLVRRLFGEWKPRVEAEPASSTPIPAPTEQRIVILDRPGAVQSVLLVAKPWPVRSAAGHEVREVLATILGGMFTSRLNRNLREQHAYTYGAGARAIATRFWGALLVSTSVKTEHTAPALEQTLLELSRAHDPGQGHPLTEQEVERAKAALVSSLGASLESVERIAEDMVLLFSQDLPLDYYANYAGALSAITRRAVEKEAEERLSPEQLLVVVVGDMSRIESPLRGLFGRVELAEPELIR
jgi:zinc protease